jgi:hypothetical protein
MRSGWKFYLNLALLGFTVGRTYVAFQRRLGKSRGQPPRQKRWN